MSVVPTTVPPFGKADHELETEYRSAPNRGRRRYVIGTSLAFCLVSIPYLWVLWDRWTGGIHPLGQMVDSNFYDLQARAMLAGHLSVPTGSLGFEAFVHDGSQFTYFGIFPSLLRLPVLIVTHSLDGRLSESSMLLAWIATGAFCSLLLWRTRILIRGSDVVGSTEAVVYGILMAAMTGGSVLVILAATPEVFEEELAWSVALTVGAMFALIGFLEKPTYGRIAVLGTFVLFAALDRGSTGYACILGTLLVAAWFGIGKMGSTNRRFAVPLVLVAVIPLALIGLVNLAKFGHVFGLSESEQIWTHVDLHRQVFLAANGNNAFGLQFLPSTLTAYFRPGGLTVRSLFPYLALPLAPAPVIGHVIFDEIDPTLSIPASMPLLTVLSVWGVVTAFRPHPIGRVRLIRIPVIAAAAGSLGVLLFGYIALRYLADFLPFLILASMIGAVDLCRRLDQRTLPTRSVAVTAVAVLAFFGIWTNIAVAISPTSSWTSVQVHSFLMAQERLDPSGLAGQLSRSSTLPISAPAGTLVDVGRCNGLYLSTGMQTADVPSWRALHSSWIAVEQGTAIDRTLRLVFNRPIGATDKPVTIMSFGDAALRVFPIGPNEVRVVLGHGTNLDLHAPLLNGPTTSIASPPIRVRPFIHYELQLMADPNLNRLSAKGLGFDLGPLTAGTGTLYVHSTGLEQTADSFLTVVDTTRPTGSTGLCEQLVHVAS